MKVSKDLHRQKLRMDFLSKELPEARAARELFDVWKRLLRRKKDFQDSWKDFTVFEKDVGPKPLGKVKLSKIYRLKPLGKENFKWLVYIRKLPNESWKEFLKRRQLHIVKDESYHRDRLSTALFFEFGLTYEQYESILIRQEFLCAICHKKEIRLNPKSRQISRLAIDHCHTTRKIRGLLCFSCNVSLGAFNDNATKLQELSRYVKKVDLGNSWLDIKPLGAFHRKQETVFKFCVDSKFYDLDANTQNDFSLDKLEKFGSVIGITKEQYALLYKAHNGVCAICREKEKISTQGKEKISNRLSIDHCHKSGKIRGLLCFKCNVFLGKIKDPDIIIPRMLKYMKKKQSYKNWLFLQPKNTRRSDKYFLCQDPLFYNRIN